MAALDHITRPICWDDDELQLHGEATFSIWLRPDGETYDAYLEPIPVQHRRQPLSRNELILLFGVRRVERAEWEALEAWLPHGPASLRQARAEERERIGAEA